MRPSCVIFTCPRTSKADSPEVLATPSGDLSAQPIAAFGLSRGHQLQWLQEVNKRRRYQFHFVLSSLMRQTDGAYMQYNTQNHLLCFLTFQMHLGDTSSSTAEHSDHI